MPTTSQSVRSAVAAQRYQRLSTTITDRETGLEAAFAVYPSSFRKTRKGRPIAVPSLEELEPSRLGFDDTGAPDHLPESTRTNQETWIRAIAASLDPDLLSREEIAPGRFRWQQRLGDIDVPEAEFAFATYLFEEPIIPVRMSPITGKSLAGLVGSASGAGAGGIIGTYAGLHHGLLIVLTTPGGMIVGGAAMGVATALEKGLHEKILQMILPPSGESSAEEAGE